MVLQTDVIPQVVRSCVTTASYHEVLVQCVELDVAWGTVVSDFSFNDCYCVSERSPIDTHVGIKSLYCSIVVPASYMA